MVRTLKNSGTQSVGCFLKHCGHWRQTFKIDWRAEFGKQKQSWKNGNSFSICSRNEVTGQRLHPRLGRREGWCRDAHLTGAEALQEEPPCEPAPGGEGWAGVGELLEAQYKNYKLYRERGFYDFISVSSIRLLLSTLEKNLLVLLEGGGEKKPLGFMHRNTWGKKWDNCRENRWTHYYSWRHRNSSSEMARSSRQKMSVDTVKLNTTINQRDIIDVYRLLYSMRIEHAFLSNLHGILTKTDHIPGHKTNLYKSKRIENIQFLLSAYNGIKLEIHNTR